MKTRACGTAKAVRKGAGKTEASPASSGRPRAEAPAACRKTKPAAGKAPKPIGTKGAGKKLRRPGPTPEFKDPTKPQEEFIKEWNEASPRDRHIIVVDEFGNTGKKHLKETKFGYGVSEVRHPNAYLGISKTMRKLHATDKREADEWKAEESPQPERVLAAAAIRLTGTRTAAVYVDKDHLPADATQRNKGRVMRGMFGRTIDETIPDSGIVWIVVDDNDQYGNRKAVEKICRERSTRSRIVEGSVYDSEGSSSPSGLIQTNDFSTNAARSKLELGKQLRSRILATRFKRLGEADGFKPSDMEGYPKNREKKR